MLLFASFSAYTCVHISTGCVLPSFSITTKWSKLVWKQILFLRGFFFFFAID